jgi:luciferase family oxidoreductase group 1
LDQSPAHESETATEAFQHTTELARKAEEWGYHRFWVAEHHGSNRVMGSSPEVLIAHLLAKTTSIRVGSGGVMLQHYSPYKVAENFNVLASLAPGRVDLGIGRGPGGLPLSTKALQRDAANGTMPLPEKVAELQKFLHNQLDEDGPFHGLYASPLPPQPPDLFMLGTNASSGEFAAELGMPYVFALFLHNDEEVMCQAIETYRNRFDCSKGARPQAMLALPVIVADTDEEAARYAAEVKVVRIRLESGRTLTVGNLEAGEEFGRQSGEKYKIEVSDAKVVHGAPETALDKLLEIQHLYHADEIFAVTAIDSFQKRLRSYELLGDIHKKAAASW